jgi:3-methylcrotonyl-CoA carboxylase alpha subunit
VVHLFERDCSLQRRHQKVIEEAPAPGMPPEMRAAMGKAAVEAARAVGYVGAGTVEFIADGREGLRPDRFFFMEMNTRLQVEHPVTEAITGLDLVELQFRVAAGERLPVTQDDLTIEGHAVEARLYAEDPEKGFLPSTGRLHALRFPSGEGLRVDTGVRQADEVTPFYDPMIAKVIAHGANRDEALDRLSAALGETVVAGPRTNVAFLKALCDASEFRTGPFDTGFIDRNLDALGAVPQARDDLAVEAGAVALLVREDERAAKRRASVSARPLSPWDASDGFRLVGGRRVGLPLVVDGERVEASIVFDGQGGSTVVVGDRDAFGRASERVEQIMTPTGVYVLRGGRQTFVTFHDPFAVDLEHMDEGGTIKAPMHGKVVAVFVAAGDRVERGQRLAVVEAMKMEHVLTAPAGGEIAEVTAEAGAQVVEGARLMVVKIDEA